MNKLYTANYFEFILKERKSLETEYNSRAFSGGSDNKESSCNVGNPSSIPGSERSPQEGNGHPLRYSLLEKSVTTGSLVSSSLWGHKKSDRIEWLILSLSCLKWFECKHKKKNLIFVPETSFCLTKKIFIYLAVLGLSCSMQALCCNANASL